MNQFQIIYLFILQNGKECVFLLFFKRISQAGTGGIIINIRFIA